MNFTSAQWNAASAWVHRNAREIDVLAWKCMFENGDIHQLLKSLKYYQNSDGGFGHALEPDSWNTESSPYTTLYAVNLLELLGFIDYDDDVYQNILRYYESAQHFSEEYGWDFSIPSNDEYPHAPWWSYSFQDNKHENIGLTAQICDFIFKAAHPQSSLVNTAKKTVHAIILPKIAGHEKIGEMTIYGFSVLLETLRQKNLIQEHEYNTYFTSVNDLISKSIEYDTSKWKNYSVRPSKYIKSPSSPYYEQYKSIIDKEVEYLIQNVPKSSVWDITWSWFGNNEKYRTEFAVSENWWKTKTALDNIVFLKNFNRIDFT